MTRARAARPGRSIVAVMLAAVAILSAACVSRPATVTRLGVPLLAQPQPPGMVPVADIKKAPGPTQCPHEAPQGIDTRFEPRKSSLRPPDPMPAPNNMPPGSTMDRIVRRGYLVAGVNQNLARFGSINPHNQTLEGFDIGIAREIAFALFGDRESVRFRAVNFSNQFEVLHDPDENKNVDILANSITITCTRRYRNHVLFTTDYFDSGQRIMVPNRSKYEKIEDLAGLKVCAPDNTTSIGKIIEIGNVVPVAVAEFTDCLALLQQGQIDAISTTDSVLLGLRDQDPTMRMAGQRITEEPHGLAIRDSEADFVRFVNGVLERVRDDGTWHQLYLRWLKGLDESIPPPPSAEYLD
jgi:polar amino acid transport system substrate-binding protein